jgi:hypothetical protein
MQSRADGLHSTMLSAILVIGLAVTALILTWSLLIPRTRDSCKDRTWDESAYLLHVQVLRALLQRNEFQYLRRTLPRAEFEKCLRKRVRLTLQTLRLAEDNTSLLAELAHKSRPDNDSEGARRADALLAGTVQLRLNLLLARSCLYLQWLFPTSALLPEWTKPYQHLLTCLEQWSLQVPVSSF